MNNLHRWVTSAYVWLRASHNRRPSAQMQLWHIYHIERQTRFPERLRNYFNPWIVNLDVEASWTPLCGRIRTTSLHPILNERPPNNVWWNPNLPECARCLLIARQRGVTPRLLPDVRNEDPWLQIPVNERNDRLDPITGT